ncbi:serine/threonine protein kinase [Planomonospora sp. ID91781]|uniref:non-specific serine/threonine protein kinase n=1 Tax=Planomonospora sphaerica TaxID=161355 RepID=A0A171DIE3_9ACTN|nr:MULTISPECIES: serine/threonine-protein kinase [Planomonospora]MBG0823753.1 serine/threonine protein kinase [Planomonospora sp. ID91781]GAT68680.1 serine/threonine protein kinase [Planomonospora sphaerica]
MGTGKRRPLGDRYQLISPTGRDGPGIIWRAHDLRLRRDVAIKEIQPLFRADGADLDGARRRAMREARSAARLSHPAVVAVHDLLEEGGRLWIVMELLEALTLKETVAHLGHLPVHWTAWIGFQLLGGLRHAHGAGVLHRDINPGNILLTGDRVVLADFGIAALNGDPSASTTVPLHCAPAYVAPERLRGLTASPAADLWSFGASLYFAVEGRPPYPGSDSLAVLGEAVNRDPDPPVKAGPLRRVLEGLLRRDPSDRITADHAARLLSAILRMEGVAVDPPRLPAARLPPDSFAR